MDDTPLKVAVIVPIYNTPSAFLTEAVESIVGQDLAGCKIQLRIFLHDDGSSIAETLGVLAEYEKNTALFSVSHSASNAGIVSGLNHLIDASLAWGAKYIARMDADDIATPDRLSRQISHLESHPAISVLGGAVKMFKSGTTLVKPVEYPTGSASVHFGMFYNCILVHPTIVFRSSLFSTSTSSPWRYSESFRYAEDYALWLHMIERGEVRLENLPNPPLLRLRKHADNESKVHQDRQKSTARRALKSVVDRLIAKYDAEPWESSADTIHCILTGYDNQTLQTIQEAFKITEIIEMHLKAQAIFSNIEKATITEECNKQLGALATMEMRLSGSTPSDQYCWKRWLTRRPQELIQLLGAATVGQKLGSLPKSATATSSSPPLPRVTVICFSKDRAFQMQEYARTLELFVVKSSPSIAFDVHVIWKASTEKFSNSYVELSQRFSTYSWVKETDFVQQLTDIVKAASPYILWGVDDVLFYNPTDLLPILRLMDSDKDILCSTLRLSPNVTYCHPSNAHSTLPQFTSISTCSASGDDVENFTQELLQFDRSTATEDWNYPFELCATIMHKSTVSDIFMEITQHNGIDGLSHPNKLEVCGSRLFSKNLGAYSSQNKCICLKNPVMSVITVNRVQDVCENRIYHEISLDELETHFDSHRILDLSYYRSKVFDAVHIGDFVLQPNKSQ